MALQPSIQGQEPTKHGKVLVYYDALEHSAMDNGGVQNQAAVSDRVLRSAYAGKFEIVPIRRSDGFIPGRVKGYAIDFVVDPRPEREETIPARVVLSWIVTTDGRAIEPRVLESTDKRVAAYLIKSISLRRFTPGRLHGNAVQTLWMDKYVFSSDGKRSRDSDLYKNGLGIQGYRDR